MKRDTKRERIVFFDGGGLQIGWRVLNNILPCPMIVKPASAPIGILSLIVVILALGMTLGLADGKVFPPTAFPQPVAMPGQRALIYFSNGVERLVIETRFHGQGTNFGWVVPVPAQPRIEGATTGLFPTLDHLFRPSVRHAVPRIHLQVMGAAVLIAYFWTARKIGRLFDAFVVVTLLVVMSSMLLPALSRASAGGGGVAVAGVEVLQEKRVGVFDTATLTAHHPDALQQWLRVNGFAVSPASGPVIDSYLRDGWVFVASKLHRADTNGVTTIHPLSFTFPTARPVYPMRLTAVESDGLQVELYAFGPGRAVANHFRTDHCARPQFLHPEWRIPPRTANLPIQHELLRNWTKGAAVATKLSARLTPAQMREDVWLDWGPFTSVETILYSRHGAFITALNWSVGFGVLATGILLAGLRLIRTLQAAARRAWLCVALAAALMGFVVYLSLPKVEVRLEKWPSVRGRVNLKNMIPLIESALGTNPPTLGNVRAVYMSLTNRPPNPFLGGPIREEDSPGNFTLVESSDGVELRAVNTAGGEMEQCIFHR